MKDFDEISQILKAEPSEGFYRQRRNFTAICSLLGLYFLADLSPKKSEWGFFGFEVGNEKAIIPLLFLALIYWTYRFTVYRSESLNGRDFKQLKLDYTKYLASQLAIEKAKNEGFRIANQSLGVSAQFTNQSTDQNFKIVVNNMTKKVAPGQVENNPEYSFSLIEMQKKKGREINEPFLLKSSFWSEYNLPFFFLLVPVVSLFISLFYEGRVLREFFVGLPELSYKCALFLSAFVSHL